MSRDPLNPLTPIGPRRTARDDREASRIDLEIERLRTNPSTPIRNPLSSGGVWMGIFSRTRVIIAANFNELLDQADDPAKMIRMIIMEMEETLVEVRASAARTIADQKEMHRHTVKLERLQSDWGEKAQLALSKDREDLARAALLEKKKAADMGEQLKTEIAVLDDALARFDQLERRVDYAEGRADALSIADGTGQPSLADEIAALESSDKIDEELEAMKRALGMSDDKKED
jgi:phage shock protein A